MKILLAEDTRDLSRAEVAILSHEGHSVEPVYDGEEAWEHLKAEAYDIVILDIMMPRMSGLEVLELMRSHGNKTPVLLLTAKAEVDDRVHGLDLGADDYLTKPFSMKELLARVRSLARRRSTYNSSELVVGDVRLNSDSLELSCDNTIRLSIKEYELMKLLMLNPGRDMTTMYLIANIWSKEPEADSDTVWLYISYLRKKLDYINAHIVIEGERGGRFRLNENTEA